MGRGRLTIVGTGYMVAGQVTQQALTCIERAEKLFHLTADPVTEAWLQGLNPSSESLHDAYGVGRDRMDSYREMVERMLAPVHRGLDVCAAFYGHPGVFAFAGHEAIRRARRDGYEASMLPGISAADCLFADLGVDPAEGCQMYEATSFLYRKRRFDPTVPLILWQIGHIAFSSVLATRSAWNQEGLRVLSQVLERDYPPDHEVIVYEAARLPVCRPKILPLPLRELAAADVTSISTLYVPPREPLEPDYDYETAQLLSAPRS
jgi:uncharacterized protein YabN with tetrapyrrole methylase and pyrophosphatase domain